MSLLVSLVVATLQLVNKKTERRIKDHEEDRRQESLLSLEMMMANNKLSYAVAMAVKRGSPNGEIEEAIVAYENAKEKYDDFIRRMAVKAVRHGD